MQIPFARAAACRRLLTATMIVVCVMGVASADAERRAKPHKENRKADSRVVEQMEEKWRLALVNSDGPALDKLLADDFMGISSNGTVSDKHQYIARLSSHQSEFKTFEVLEQKIRVQPGLAVATSEARVIGSLESRPIRGIFRYTKVYSRDTTGQWKVLSFEATRVSGPRSDSMDLLQGQPLGRSNSAAPATAEPSAP